MLKKDDWELTLREAKNHKNGQLIALAISEAVIKLAEIKIAEFPEKKNENKSKAEKQTF